MKALAAALLTCSLDADGADNALKSPDPKRFRLEWICGERQKIELASSMHRAGDKLPLTMSPLPTPLRNRDISEIVGSIVFTEPVLTHNSEIDVVFKNDAEAAFPSAYNLFLPIAAPASVETGAAILLLTWHVPPYGRDEFSWLAFCGEASGLIVGAVAAFAEVCQACDDTIVFLTRWSASPDAPEAIRNFSTALIA